MSAENKTPTTQRYEKFHKTNNTLDRELLCNLIFGIMIKKI